MAGRALLGCVWLALAGCLEAPPAAGADCSTVTDFSDPDEFTATWSKSAPSACDCDPSGGLLVIDNDPAEAPCECHFGSPRGLPLATEAPSIRLALPGAGMSASFSFIVDGDLRALYFSRSRGDLLFGECIEGVCDNTAFGLITFTELGTSWWRFRYDDGDAAVHYETSADGEEWTDQSKAPVTPSELAGAVLDVGSYEEELFADVIGFDDLRVCPP